MEITNENSCSCRDSFRCCCRSSVRKKENPLKLLKKEKSEQGKKIVMQNKNNIQKRSQKKERINIKEKLKDLKQLEGFLREKGAYPENLEILEYLDGGSEGNIYSSLITPPKKKSGIKKNAIMKLILADDKETRKEAYISSKLKDSHVIDFYGYSIIEQRESSFMLLDYAKYGNLRNFQRKTIKRLMFSESTICFFAYQILSGIIYCHKCKIAHLDIKPQNIVVDEYVNAKLIDFSISLDYKNKNLEDKLEVPFRGTSFYMSKEVIKSERIKYKDLNKIDMYAFGVLLYNLAYAKYPFELTHGDEADYSKIYYKITNNPLTFPDDSSYSSHFKDFVSKLLEKDINKRMNMYEALNHYWMNGAKILNDEKEKCYNVGAFISYLLTDHIREFNEYMQRHD